MPVPVSYTETTLAAFLAATLADVAPALGWVADAGAFPGTTPAPLVEAVYETEYAYGPTDPTATPPTYSIALMADTKKLRALARREAWRAAMDAAAARVNKRVGDLSKSESSLYDQCHANFLSAVTDAAAYDGANVIGVASVTYAPDVYGPLNTSGEFA